MARKRRLTLDSERKRRRNEMLPRPRPEQQLGNIASCYEVNCSNNKGRNPDLCFFTFPKDPERCRKWVINSKREDLLQKTSDYTHRNCRLCSNHFEDSQFMNSIKNSLIKTAIPTLFSISNLPKQIFPKTTPAASMDKCLSKRNKLKGAPKMVKNTLNNESGTRRKQSIICRIDDSLILKRGVPKMVKNTSSVESSTRRRKQSIICRKDDCLKAKTDNENYEEADAGGDDDVDDADDDDDASGGDDVEDDAVGGAGAGVEGDESGGTDVEGDTNGSDDVKDDAGGSDDGEDDASGSYDDHANGSDAVEDDASDSDDGEGDVSGSYDDDANGSDAVEDDASGSDDGEDDADAGGCADEAKAWCECRARTEALRARVWRAEQLLERVLGQLEAEEQRRPDAAAGDGGGERAGDGQRAGADVDTVVLGQPG
ncbi:uncharacterized protein LOC103507797 isoform X2, partial [Gryllus bimaculatus]